MRRWSSWRLRPRPITVSGEAIVPERSLTATPMRFEPRSKPSARTGQVDAGGHDGVLRDRQGVADAAGVLASRRRDVALAAASADRLRGVADQSRSLDAQSTTAR